MSIFTKVEDFLVGSENRGLLKKSAGQALLAGTAVSNVGKVAISKVAPLVGKAAGKVKDVYLQKLAQKPIVVGAASLVAGGYVASNPKGAVSDLNTIPKNLSNFGSNIRNIRDNPSKENIVKTFEENPLISTAVVGATGYVAARGAGLLLNSFDNMGKSGINNEDTSGYLDQFKKEIPNNFNIPTKSDIPTIPEYKSEKQTSQDLTPPMYSGTPLPVPEKNLVSYGNKEVSTTRKKKKTKTLYTSPFRVTNRINIFNKNG